MKLTRMAAVEANGRINKVIRELEQLQSDVNDLKLYIDENAERLPEKGFSSLELRQMIDRTVRISEVSLAELAVGRKWIDGIIDSEEQKSGH